MLWRGFLRNFEEQKRSWLMKKLTIARSDVNGSTLKALNFKLTCADLKALGRIQ